MHGFITIKFNGPPILFAKWIPPLARPKLRKKIKFHSLYARTKPHQNITVTLSYAPCYLILEELFCKVLDSFDFIEIRICVTIRHFVDVIKIRAPKILSKRRHKILVRSSLSPPLSKILVAPTVLDLLNAYQ